MDASQTKLLIAIALFMTWLLLVTCHVSGADDLVQFCKTGLLGLGLYHASGTGQRRASPPPPPVAPAPPTEVLVAQPGALP